MSSDPTPADPDRRDLWWESVTREIGKTAHLVLPEPFVTAHGATLDRVQVSWESWGELNEARDNVVLVSHFLTSDCHATGEFREEPMGWWEPLIGPGKAIDTDRWFVVCPNLLGSCYGATGPRFPAPDGAPYLGRFPLLTPRDLMRVQRLFLDAIGVRHLRLVVGPSVGGMVAWEWAVEGGGFADVVVVVAAPLRTNPHQIGLNWLQRRGVELDIEGNAESAAFGQMISRGIGMVSYRSPVGLDEKFGRGWFKEPGATLAERGMFNVESWLRYQGKKSVRRFCPYSYILLTRAMDLHDVGAGRGGFVSALDRVKGRTLVVGISSDNLYTPAEVHLGADILSHLGKHVEYAEISSPHGHDAFLLETAQIGEMLRDVCTRQARTVSAPSQRDLRTVRVGILGAGRVTALFLDVLAERRAQIEQEHGLRFDVRAVADADPSKRLPERHAGVALGFEPERLVARDDLDVVLEVTRGRDTGALVEAALHRGRPVATVNKRLVREHGAHLEQVAYAHGVRLAWHNAVAAGWPLLYAVERPLVREQFRSIHAMLSSTCNVVLEGIEAGESPEAALARATEMGVTEPDPDLDLSGWDSGQKLLILAARTLGLRFSEGQVRVRGIDGIDAEIVRAAPGLGLRVKLVAMLVREGAAETTAAVLPVAVRAESHLGTVRGIDNVVVLSGEQTGEMVHLGQGTGSLPVATALLNDLIGLFRPSMSWTGGLPRSAWAAEEPVFARRLLRDATGTVAVADGLSGGVPLLDSRT